ncbi:hypothetical protein U9M48_016390 [Paspalum notatum var. saurae]|uniref:Uncharacterized protein n=1 Tax=Paspalum notatum var. saurae TaxID=547442 RepID=A0AAQ3T677_PASNO
MIHPSSPANKRGSSRPCTLFCIFTLHSCTFSHTPQYSSPCRHCCFCSPQEERQEEDDDMEEKRRGDGGFAVLGGLLGAAVLAFLLLPKPAGAAAADKWQWHGDHAAASPSPLAVAGLPPLSAPPPTAGADLPPTTYSHSPPGSGKQQTAPHFGFPLQPPTLGSGSAPPPADSGDGYPFIGSNPTAPLPTGMTDTDTVLPLPDTAGDATNTKVVGLAAAPVRAHVSSSIIGPLLFFAIFYFLSTTT